MESEVLEEIAMSVDVRYFLAMNCNKRIACLVFGLQMIAIVYLLAMLNNSMPASKLGTNSFLNEVFAKQMKEISKISSSQKDLKPLQKSLQVSKLQDSPLNLYSLENFARRGWQFPIDSTKCVFTKQVEVRKY